MAEPDLGAEMVFDDITPRTVPVTIAGKKYVLHQAMGDATIRWRNQVLKNTKYNDGKVANIEGMADTEPFLVSLCLFEAGEAGLRCNADGSPNGLYAVPLATIRKWPPTIIKALHTRIMAISGLEKKPDPNASTTDGSSSDESSDKTPSV